jgi:putative restriction endonuclease
MNKILQFYNYDKALAYFEDRLMHIHQAPVKRTGLKAVAKPVLLLTVLKAIDEGDITANRFDYDQLEPHYLSLFKKYFMQARQESLTPMCYPWYFMSHDDFWHLSWQGSEPIKTETPSVAFIHRNTTHAYFSDDLWTLVSHPGYRHQLMEFLIKEKIVAPFFADSDSMAAENGATLKSLLMMLIAI